jgi:long-chain acyl-CoA synthetase
MSAFALTEADLLRVSRDLAYSDLAAMPGIKACLGPRISADPHAAPLSWTADLLDLDSLARMQLATAAATWCNAYDAGFEDLFLAKRTAADWAVVMRRAREAGAKQLTFATSGSTGTRKHLRHREDILANEARAWASVLGPVKRVVVLCPTHHIYGFIWGVLVPLALGVPAVDADLTSLPALQSGDLVVAVPDQWAWLAASQRALPAGVQGVSSTAPLPAQVHDALTLTPAGTAANAPTDAPSTRQMHTPLARLLQIYGSTETAGLAYRTQSAGPYTLAPGRTRNAQDGINLQLPSGALQALAVQDDLQWTSDTTFNLLRRTDESVQVGGHNVSPAWVVAQLQTNSAVKEAAVRLDGATTPKLKAFVVLHSAAHVEVEADVTTMHVEHRATQSAALEQWVLDTLPWYANFSSITYGSALPRNALGKPSDWPTSL